MNKALSDLRYTISSVPIKWEEGEVDRCRLAGYYIDGHQWRVEVELPAVGLRSELSPSPASDEVSSRLLPVLQALADPARLRIVLMLREGERCVCHLTEALGLTQGTVSHHMAVLRRAGLVQDRRGGSDARWVHYSLVPSARRLDRILLELLGVSQSGDTTGAAVAAEAKSGRVKRLSGRVGGKG